MGYFQKVFALKDELARNPNSGTWAWLLHRLSGIALILYVFPHFWVISSAMLGPGGFDHRLALVQTELFHVLEIGLIGVIFFHMLNGLRVTLVDFLPWTRAHKPILAIAVVLFLFVMAGTLYTWNLHFFHFGGAHAVP